MFTQYKGKNMSLSVLLVSAGVIGVCGFIFKKTVSNDAKNDFRLRDILMSESPYEEDVSEEVKVAPKSDITKPKFFNELKKEDMQQETVATKTLCDEPEEETKGNYSYSANAYSTNTHGNNDNKSINEKESYEYDNGAVYYEKINDDACESDYDNDDELEEEYQQTAYQKNYRYFAEEEPQDYQSKEQEPKVVKKSLALNLFGFVKTFWRGITFSLGALICLYAFYGVVAQAETSNDALLYSIWLLIGVILIK
jgi:hypothetical protein